MRRAGTTARRMAAAGVLALCLAGAGQASAADYVAMGDSYSSGTGTRDYYDENCERSNFAYSKLIDPQIPGDWNMVACGGATTNSVLNSGQHGNPAQAADPALTASTDHVTISIGGNDAGFSSVLLECGQPGWMSDCDGAIDGAQNTIQNTLPGRLNTVADRIRSETSANTIVTFVGYPRIFNGEDCNAATFFEGGEMTRLNEMADLLADVMRTQARENGYSYADARGAYLGHAVCDDAEWLNGLSNPTGESFHPNKSGHQGYAGIVRSALLSAEQPSVARGPNGRIAFARDGEVWAINGNGQFPVNLSNDPAADIDPAWSPDGTKLAFASNRDGDHEIYVLDFVNGGTPAKLTSNSAEDREPTWSPNGDFIAFRSARDGNNEIYKMTAAGGSQTRLTANADSEFAPDWSPDGAEIAYQRFGSQNDVWKMNSDGQGQTRLTTDGAHDGHPVWSPSGHQIAFHSNRGPAGSDFEIFTMTATGGSQTARTSNADHDRDPAWSPNGSQIAFARGNDGTTEIYTMTSTGGSQTRRTTTADGDSTPSWQGDKTDPQTSFASGPAQGSTTNLSTPTFGLASNEPGSTFECKVDAGSFAPCSTPFTTQPLPDGLHTVEVRATDPSANADDTAATRTFTVDTTPAGTAINGAPGELTNDSTPQFSFSSADSDLDYFECRVDDGEFAECESPFTPPALADGPHTFEVRAVDEAGTPGPVQSATFVVDTTAPETSFVSTPRDPGNEPMPSFEFESSEEQSTFSCRLDSAAGGTWGPCVSPFVVDTALADGPHQVEVAATDQAGNPDGSPASFDFEIDTVAPGATIDADPGATTGDSTPQFSFSSADSSASFECRVDSLDDGDWAACASPHTVASLVDGEHFFQVRAIDAAGNAGEPDEHDFVVDVTVPVTTLSAGPADGARFNPDVGPNYVFSANDDFATFECSLEPTPKEWVECEPDQALREIFGEWSTDPQTGEPVVDPIELTQNATYTFQVRAVDSVGNRDASVEQRTFVYDSVAPQLTASNLAPRINDSTPSLTFTSTDAHLAGFECRIDTGDWDDCESPYTAPELDDGEHTIGIRAVDEAGNRTAVARTFVVDTVGPALEITGSAAPLSRDSTPTFEFTAEAGAQLACSLDNQAFASCASPLTRDVADGEHRFEVRATDAAGNATFASREFTVDTNAPLVAITAGPANGDRLSSSSASFGFATTEVATYECRLDSPGQAGAFGPCESPAQLDALVNGAHTFHVRATDAAGNTGPATQRSFTVDAARPGADGDFALGKLKRNTKKGTAKLVVTTTAAGALQLTGKGLKRAKARAQGGTAVRLAVKPKRKLAAKLADAGAAKVKITVSFAPDGDRPRSKSKRIKLVRR